VPEPIAYRAGYKYQLATAYTVRVAIRPKKTLRTDWLTLTPAGDLTIAAGYAWDGPSGPAIDTATFMRASLLHDALYQLLRLALLPARHRAVADDLMREVCLEDGMCRARAWWAHRAVRLGAGPAADPATERPVFYAPRAA
jgi:hypothetical protein